MARKYHSFRNLMNSDMREKILAGIREAKTVIEVCRENGISTEPLYAHLAKSKEFADQYREARKQGDKCLVEIAETSLKTCLVSDEHGVRMRTAQWLLERNPASRYRQGGIDVSLNRIVIDFGKTTQQTGGASDDESGDASDR
jgi:hypothetical protein